MSPYVYCAGNPVKYVDPDGRDAVFIVFPDYKISTPIGKLSNLGHAGVLLIDNETGVTKYYEYGRYDEANKGVVRNFPVPDVKIDKQTNLPTKESLNKTLSSISKKSGQGGNIEGAYINGDYNKMKDYATNKFNESNKGNNGYNENRESYDLFNNNCGTFAADVVSQDPIVDKEMPFFVDPRPNSMIEEMQENFNPIHYDANQNQTNY